MVKASPLPPAVARFMAWPRFQGLPAEVIGLIATAGRQRQYPSGSVLAHQRDPTDCLHVVIKGAIQIERWHSALVSPVVLATLGPGDVVGNRIETADGSRLSVSAVATEPTTTMELDGEAMALLVVRYPELGRILVCRIGDVASDDGAEATGESDPPSPSAGEAPLLQ